jgi:HlyD family secretion protein
MLLKNKKMIAFAILLVLAVGISYLSFSNNKNSSLKVFEVKRGDVVQKVSETGQIEKGDKIELSFKEAGKIERIYFKEGEKVKKGALLAKLDTQELAIQLESAKADRELAQAKLEKLLKGATEEEIALGEAEVKAAQVNLESAKESLDIVRQQTENNIKQAYEDALNAMNEASLDIDKALQTAEDIQRKYFTATDQESLKVKGDVSRIKEEKAKIDSLLDIANKTNSESDIDNALNQMKSGLFVIAGALKEAREVCESAVYRNTVSTSDKSSLDAQKSAIQTARSEIISSIQSIADIKIESKKALAAEEAEVSLREASLEEAEKNLAKIKSPPTREDIALAEAEVKKAKENVALYQKKLEDAFLRAPFDGEVIEVLKREGERVSPSQGVLVFLPESPFQVKVDIYEEDIAKIKISDPVAVEVVAFPEEKLKGRVVDISPAEKIIEGVVYYEVTIAFENPPDFLKPGLTSDITIKTGERKNVLYVPKSAITQKEGKPTVQVLRENGALEEMEIKTGLEGEKNVEVVSGLREGERVVLP